MDRHTNGPDGSGGASPTVMTSPHDDDSLVTDDDQDTRPADLMAPPRKSAVAMPASAIKDASTNGGPPVGKVGPGIPADASADAADAVPALPADTIGSARDSTLVFTNPTSGPASPGADDWMPGDTGKPSPGGAPAKTSSAPAEPSGSALSGTASSPEPTRQDALPTVPASPEPSPSTVTAAAFAWETPEPPPAPQSSPPRNFLRTTGNVNVAAAAGAAAAASATKTAPDRAAEPARGKPQKRSSRRAARQAHLTVARIEPWSVMKFSFVVSLVAFVILFIAVSVLFGTLSALGVFDSLQRVVTSVTSSQDSTGVNAARWFTASRVLGYTALLGSLNIVLITAMSTIGAVIYNLTARLVGGIEVTLRETE